MNRFFYSYLFAVPFLAAGIGFGFGGVSNQLTIPVWIVHSLLMVYMFSRMSKSDNQDDHHFRTPAILLFVPWVMFTIFAGFGPPPETPARWLAAVSQQQVRYFILSAGAIISATGFSILSNALSQAGQQVIARAGLVLIFVSAPLYLLNMLYWGFYLPHAFASFINTDVVDRPAWYTATRELFAWVGSFSTALIYAATCFFIIGLRRIGRISKTPALVYIVFSIIACVFCFVPASFPVPFNIIGYFVSIPAICFIIPYLVSLTLAASASK